MKTHTCNGKHFGKGFLKIFRFQITPIETHRGERGLNDTTMLVQWHSNGTMLSIKFSCFCVVQKGERGDPGNDGEDGITGIKVSSLSTSLS